MEQEIQESEAVVMEEQEYISHKIVKRLPMTRLEYNNLRKWELPEDENGADEGYMVEYLDGGEPNVPGFDGYISWSPKKQFDDGYTKLSKEKPNKDYPFVDVKEKSLGNTDQNTCRSNVSDVVIFGEDLFKLLSKASSKIEGWMKSSKAMQTPTGCVVQVTTQQKNSDGSYSVAEAITHVPGVRIIETKNEDGVVTGRILG